MVGMRIVLAASLTASVLLSCAARGQSFTEEVPTLDEILAPRAGASSRPEDSLDAAPTSGDGGVEVVQRLVRAVIIYKLAEEGYTNPDAAVRLLDISQRVDWTEVGNAVEAADGIVDEELEWLFSLDAALAAHVEAQRAEGDTPAESVRRAQAELYVARAGHDIRMMEERESVIRITNWISWFIFIVAHVILGIGLWAAVHEFQHAMKTRKETPAPSSPAALAQAVAAAAPGVAPTADVAKLALAENEIKISLEGVALKTALHGILLLVVAIGFYFLYLKFVYPVTVVGE